jgi:hypothetical protein
VSDTRPPPSPRTGAVVAGASLLLMAAVAMPATLLAVGPLTGEGPVPTESTVRAGAVGFLLVALLDVLVAWGLWCVLRRASPDVATLAAWLRVAYSAVLAAAAPVLLQPWAGGAAPAEADLRAAGDRFADMWQAGLVLFGVHLLLLALIGLRTGAVPRGISALLLVAGAAYVVDGLLHLGLGGAGEAVETALLLVLLVASAGGELALAGWLLWRGGRPPAAPARRGADEWSVPPAAVEARGA